MFLYFRRHIFKNAPITWAIFYITLIPLYGFMYYLCKDQFYHSSLKYEKESIAIKEQAKISLQDSLKDMLNDSYGEEGLKIGNWRLKGTSIEIADIDSTPTGICATITVAPDYTLKPRSKYARNYKAKTFELYIDLSEGHGEVNNLFSCKYEPSELVLKGNIGSDTVNINTSSIFDSHNKQESKNDIAFICLLGKTRNSLSIFHNTANGLPKNTVDNVIRMFYLSAVTITTLGFGDIVPLTKTTRLLVSSEAILGIVTIGLFLNAIAAKAGKQQHVCWCKANAEQ